MFPTFSSNSVNQKRNPSDNSTGLPDYDNEKNRKLSFISYESQNFKKNNSPESQKDIFYFRYDNTERKIVYFMLLFLPSLFVFLSIS
jgi:hypothetical protein